jgi:hypothetical protein
MPSVLNPKIKPVQGTKPFSALLYLPYMCSGGCKKFRFVQAADITKAFLNQCADKLGVYLNNYVMHSVEGDISIEYHHLTIPYQKLWKAEISCKSVKANIGLARSPTHTVQIQSNHFFTPIYAYFNLKLLKLKYPTNYFRPQASFTSKYCRALTDCCIT